MTNVPFSSLQDFRDIESINAYHEYVESGRISREDMMRYLRCKSRDNARTPMQWADKENAGFTEGTPWIMVNPNYPKINAEDQLSREDSVFHYYQKLIRLRKEHEIIVYGNYTLLLPKDPALYVYTRELNGEKLLVICNFSDQAKDFSLPDGFTPQKLTRLIGNYERPAAEASFMLRPYEAVVFLQASE